MVIRSHGVGRETENYLIEHEIPYIDATCPFVKKIQNIVSEKHAEGYQIVIIGDKTHPEVIGINGWCENKGIILGKKEDINGVIWPQDKLCVVAQTTQSRDFWKFITDFIKNTCQNTLLFDTICNATNERQKEAGEIAQKSDVCIVIGGRHSSNTCKLYDICKSRCPETFHIERADELNGLSPSGAIIGMTAGASTPDWIIKEVLETMAETETESMAME